MQAPEAKYEGSIAFGVFVRGALTALEIAVFVIRVRLPRSTTPTTSTTTKAPRTVTTRHLG